MTTVVRPVSIKNTNFSFSRITFFANKIFLQKFNISQVHSKTHFSTVSFKFRIVPSNKTSHNRNITRFFALNFQSFRNRIISKSRINRVNQIILNFSHIVSTNISTQNNNLGTTNSRSFSTNLACSRHSRTQQRKTLFSTIRTLIILTRQIFPYNYSLALSHINLVIINKITLRFAKNPGSRSLTNSLSHIFNIITIQITHASYTSNAQKTLYLRQITSSLVSKTRLSFYI